ncbi:MAG: hypothetical protein KDI34_21345 [Halioglobus sp.]|nr:hypothetical protein [Halioglobus sp.]
MAASTLQQLVISLDTRIPLEAMILQRLYRLPQNRQNEWLRQLLLVGFRSECQVIRSEQALPACAIPMSQPPTTETMVDHAVRSSGSSHNTERSGLAPQNNTRKPFTHLRRVIGE